MAGAGDALRRWEGAGLAGLNVPDLCLTMVHSNPDCVKLVSPDGRLLFMNDSGICLMELDDYAVVANQPWAELWPEDSREIVRSSVRAAASGETIRFQGQCPTSKGCSKWWDIYVSPIRDMAGNVQVLLSVSRDMTAFKETERRLEAALRMAESAARAKDEFLANLSHELRTPLTSILGYAELMAASHRLPPENLGSVARIRSAGATLLALLNDLLDLARADAGALALRDEPCDLLEVARAVEALTAPLIDDKPVVFSLTCDEQLRGSYAFDARRLQQVVLNLVANAIKFTDRGEVRLSLRREAECELLIEVADTGEGIAKSAQAGLFERFTQVDGGFRRRHGGAGLGLAICRELVELMGGHIGVESRVGRGSVFQVRLPLRTVEGVEPSAEDAPVEAPVGLRVLVADDNPANQQLLSLVLQAGGHSPFVVGDGAEALRAARAQEFDVILMDIQMPVMDGLTAIRRLRRTRRTAEIPILAITANVFPEQVESYLAAGAIGCIGKPFDASHVLTEVARVATERDGLRSSLNAAPATAAASRRR